MRAATRRRIARRQRIARRRFVAAQRPHARSAPCSATNTETTARAFAVELRPADELAARRGRVSQYQVPGMVRLSWKRRGASRHRARGGARIHRGQARTRPKPATCGVAASQRRRHQAGTSRFSAFTIRRGRAPSHPVDPRAAGDGDQRCSVHDDRTGCTGARCIRCRSMDVPRDAHLVRLGEPRERFRSGSTVLPRLTSRT